MTNHCQDPMIHIMVHLHVLLWLHLWVLRRMSSMPSLLECAPGPSCWNLSHAARGLVTRGMRLPSLIWYMANLHLCWPLIAGLAEITANSEETCKTLIQNCLEEFIKKKKLDQGVQAFFVEEYVYDLLPHFIKRSWMLCYEREMLSFDV